VNFCVFVCLRQQKVRSPLLPLNGTQINTHLHSRDKQIQLKPFNVVPKKEIRVNVVQLQKKGETVSFVFEAYTENDTITTADEPLQACS